jgi:competence protein ComEC
MLLLLLIGVATIYFLFVGGFASIKRAYVMLLVLLVGDLLREKSSPINTLGVALTILLIMDPSISLNIGFQLSFMATFSILLFVKPVTALLEKLLPRRKKEIALLLGPVSLAVYVFNSFLRKILIINASVYVLCLPVMLFYFGKVPILGFYYNLFVPMLIAALLLLAIISLICPLFFPLLKWGAEGLISGLLYYPTHLDFQIRWEGMPLFILALILSILIVLGCSLQSRGQFCPNRG